VKIYIEYWNQTYEEIIEVPSRRCTRPEFFFDVDAQISDRQRFFDETSEKKIEI
jgi:hypothetical protein